MPLKIDKNIPLPSDYKVPKRPGKYDLLADMVDYDSVFFPNTSKGSVRQSIGLYVKSQPVEKQKDYDFHDYECTENGQVGVRIWLNPYKPKQDEDDEKKNSAAQNQ